MNTFSPYFLSFLLRALFLFFFFFFACDLLNNNTKIDTFSSKLRIHHHVNIQIHVGRIYLGSSYDTTLIVDCVEVLYKICIGAIYTIGTRYSAYTDFWKEDELL